MSSFLQLHQNNSVFGTIQQLSSSKSISNRALLLKALSGSKAIIQNLSIARDTQLMLHLIGSQDKIINVLDAGTTMRFLTAYFALTGKNKIMTGTDRMKERPIGLLVDALQKLGTHIDYLGMEGFPPIEIKGFSKQLTSEIEIPGNVSSQYISALMMTAPILQQGLVIKLKGEVGSVPYIRMTASLMEEFGVHPELHFEKGFIKVRNQPYQPASVTVEADWSSASYWFGFVALADQADITLPNVSEKSLQGDRVIVDIMDRVGVKAQFENGHIRLTKKQATERLVWDFKDCPDLAQTVLPACAAKGISGEFTGLESLRIKETDRIAALQSELKKIGATLSEPSTGKWKLVPGKISNQTISISTYHDHRMAMGFAPWATLTNLTIQTPEVVNKSYPTFWDDLQSVGFEIKRGEN